MCLVHCLNITKGNIYGRNEGRNQMYVSVRIKDGSEGENSKDVIARCILTGAYTNVYIRAGFL
jgi:hypothetical protein